MSSEWSKMIFAKNLRYYMELNGKNQKELAEIAKVTAPTFNEWINAKKYPRIDKIQRLADYFGILKSDLIEDKLTDEKKKDNELLAKIIVRLRSDEAFYSIVKILFSFNSDKIEGVKSFLDAFVK